MTSSPDQCAREVLEVVPIVIRVIRARMRQSRTPVLTVPQFRALVFVSDYPDASLSQVADHVGLTLPSTSTLVDGLVKRKFVTRRIHPSDRRRMTLALTAQGRQVLQAARQSTQAFLADQLAQASEADRATVVKAMAILRQVFSTHPSP